MSTDYEPGTVAIVTDKLGRTGRGICNAKGGWDFTPEGSDLSCYSLAHEIIDVRPLVVLDLGANDLGVLSDAWANVEKAMKEGHSLPIIIEQVRDQIEAQTKPPKPTEPHGLGAVVEDSGHRLWIRHSNTPGSFPWILEGVGARGWSEIDAVKVLSEGVVR